jgi:superkiller protein 3
MFRKNPWLGSALAALLVIASAPVAQADLDQGMANFRSGKYLEAAAEFQSLVDQSPSYDYGYFMLGLSFLKMGKVADAEKNLLKAIELNGDRFEYHHALAKAYYDQRQWSQAVGTLRTAEPLANDKTRWNLYFLRGVSYAALEKWADAIDDLEKARALKPTAALLDRLGSAYYELGHYDKALPVLKQALKESPNSAALLVRTANTLLYLGAESKNDGEKDAFYREALTYADKYNAARPNTIDGNNLVGRSALGAKDYGRAEQAFRKVLALKSDHCFAMANLGKTYIAQQRWADAEQILIDAATCAPRMAVVYESLGFAQQKQKKLEQAIKSYEMAYGIAPSPSIQRAIDTAKQNIEVAGHNEEMARLEAQQKAAEEEEAARVAAEEAKAKEWEERRARDD